MLVSLLSTALPSLAARPCAYPLCQDAPRTSLQIFQEVQKDLVPLSVQVELPITINNATVNDSNQPNSPLFNLLSY